MPTLFQYLGLLTSRLYDEPVPQRVTRGAPAVVTGEDGVVTMHAGQLHVDARTVLRLVETQFPSGADCRSLSWARLALCTRSSGSATTWPLGSRW